MDVFSNMPINFAKDHQVFTFSVLFFAVYRGHSGPDYSPTFDTPYLEASNSWTQLSDWNGFSALDCWDTFVAKCSSSVTIQLTPTIGTGENAALKVFQEVCGRTMMLNMIVTDTTGRMAMTMGSSGPSVDYGDNVRQAVKALEAVVPQEHLMAGMVGWDCETFERGLLKWLGRALDSYLNDKLSMLHSDLNLQENGISANW